MESSSYCDSVPANLIFFWMEKRFVSGMDICCMFPLIFTTTFTLMLTVLLSFDFSVKVTKCKDSHVVRFCELQLQSFDKLFCNVGFTASSIHKNCCDFGRRLVRWHHFYHHFAHRNHGGVFIWWHNLFTCRIL